LIVLHLLKVLKLRRVVFMRVYLGLLFAMRLVLRSLSRGRGLLLLFRDFLLSFLRRFLVLAHLVTIRKLPLAFLLHQLLLFSNY